MTATSHVRVADPPLWSHPAALDERTGRCRAFRDRFAVQWHLSDHCDRACRHCYRSGPTRPELGTTGRLAVLDEVAAFLDRAGWPGRIHFAGGEPLLCDDLLPMVLEARRRGLPSRVLTGGSPVETGLGRALSAAGCVGVQVSLEGPRAVHDGLRGPGSFDHALDGARRLADEGMPVTLAMTLHDGNVDELEELASLARGRAVRLYFSRLVPAGRGAALGGLLGRSAWRAAMRRIRRLAKDGELSVAMRDPTFAPFGRRRDGDASPGCVSGCAAGYNTLTIESDGALMPCRRLGIELGRLGRDRLEDVWRDAPLLRALRERNALGGRCGRCRFTWVCGGCRAVAHAVTGDPLAEDPQCPW